MHIANNIIELVGNTPLVKLNVLNTNLSTTVLVKLEFFNPGASVKDRLAKAMILSAEASGKITPETTIIEPSSGNTGIGLAMICAARKYKLIITMPESVSVERRALISAFGAKVVLTPAEKGMSGAIAKANELANESTNSFIPMQFENQSNAEMHYKTTGPEIWKDTAGKIDIFVAGVGTGGTITGVSKFLKEQKPSVEVVAVEPEASPVLSGGLPAPHKIQGIGAGFIPKILNTKAYSEIIKVANTHAIETAKLLASSEGILGGISSGANVWAALELANRPENAGKTIVTIICDTGERYLSTGIFA